MKRLFFAGLAVAAMAIATPSAQADHCRSGYGYGGFGGYGGSYGYSQTYRPSYGYSSYRYSTPRYGFSNYGYGNRGYGYGGGGFGLYINTGRSGHHHHHHSHRGRRY